MSAYQLYMTSVLVQAGCCNGNGMPFCCVLWRQRGCRLAAAMEMTWHFAAYYDVSVGAGWRLQWKWHGILLRIMTSVSVQAGGCNGNDMAFYLHIITSVCIRVQLSHPSKKWHDILGTYYHVSVCVCVCVCKRTYT